MRKKSKVEPMVKAKTLITYLDNLAKDGTGYVIHYYPSNGEPPIIEHNFHEASKAYKREVAVDLTNTAMGLLDETR